MGFLTGEDKLERRKELLKFPYWKLVKMLVDAGYHKEVAKVLHDAAEKSKKTGEVTS